MCGFPTLRWNKQWGKIRPALFTPATDGVWEGGVTIKPNTLVLHSGMRLVVRLGPQLRTILQTKQADIPSDLELDNVVTKGALISELVEMRGRIETHDPDTWRIIRDALKQQFPNFADIDGVASVPYATMALVSYDVEQVVYEWGASIDDGDY